MMFHCAKKKVCQLQLGNLEEREDCPGDPCPGLGGVLEECRPS